jgi:hypothetical protein
MKNHHYRSLLISIFIILISPILVFGQNSDELCRAFVNRAFGDAGNNCANLPAGEACYGFGNFGEVTTSYYVDGTSQIVREDVFAEASDRIALLDMDALTTLESIETEAFALDSDNSGEDETHWGLAMLNVPANLPTAIDNSTAVYLLFGGARLENAVLPEDSIVVAENPVTVTANANSDIFSAPEGLGFSIPANVVGTVSGELEADGISSDGNWVRVLFSYERDFGVRTSAWINVENLSASTGIENLPVMAADSYTAMQSFYLSNELELPECTAVVAPGLLIQGPSEVETDFVLNEMPVRVTSTVYIRQISENRLQLIAISGFTVLYPDSASQELIPAGFTKTVCLAEAQSLGIDGQANDRPVDPNCPEGDAHPLNNGELQALASLNRLPANILNYGVTMSTLVCPSGVGDAQCIIIPASPERIEEACEAGLLPEEICQSYGF